MANIAEQDMAEWRKRYPVEGQQAGQVAPTDAGYKGPAPATGGAEPSYAAPANNGAPPGMTDPFAASGGGTYANGGWIPNSNQASSGYTAPGSTNSSYSLTAQSGSPTPPSFGDAVRGQILSQMGKNENEASINDADLAPQASANRDALERARRAGQEGLAERFSAEGVPTSSGAFGTGVQQGFEKMGQQQAGFESQLVGQKLTERKAQLMQALGMGAEMMSNDQKIEIQRQLADIDAAVRREGYATQSSIAGQEDSTRRQLGIGGLNLGFIEAMLQNGQANNRLGFDIGDAEARWNNAAGSFLGGR